MSRDAKQLLPTGVRNFRNLGLSLGTPADYGNGKAIADGIVEPCSDLTNWTGFNAGAVSAWTANVRSHDGTNIQSIRLGTLAADRWAVHALGSAVNCTAKIFGMRVYLPPDSNPSDLVAVQMLLANGSASIRPKPYAAAGAESARATIQRTGDVHTVEGRNKGGWWETHVAVNEMEVTSGFNPANVTGVYVRGVRSSGSPDVILDRVVLYDSPLASGMYAIRIDASSSFTEQHYVEIQGKADSLGVPVAWGISPRAVHDGLIDEALVRRIHSDGAELATYAGIVGTLGPDVIPNNWIDKSDAQKVRQSEYNRKWWQDLEIGQDASEVLFLSGGSGWTQQDHDVLLPKYFGVMSDLRAYNNPLNDPRYLYTSYFLDATDGTLPTEITAKISDAEAAKTCFILGSHVATQNERTSLKLALEAIAASGLVGKTFRQLHKGI